MPIFPRTTLGMIAGAIYTGILLYAALGDLRSRRIPNRMVLVLAMGGFGFSVGMAPLLSGALRASGGLVTGLVCWLPFYMLGWVGAGDVKLFAASGSWLGATRTIEAAVVAAIVGAVLALTYVVWNHGLRRAIETAWLAAAAPAVLASSANSGRSSRSLPYGVALAAGALVAAWMPDVLLRR
jgi:prepilin peptidase CpaA